MAFHKIQHTRSSVHLMFKTVDFKFLVLEKISNACPLVFIASKGHQGV